MFQVRTQAGKVNCYRAELLCFPLRSAAIEGNIVAKRDTTEKGFSFFHLSVVSMDIVVFAIWLFFTG